MDSAALRSRSTTAVAAVSETPASAYVLRLTNGVYDPTRLAKQLAVELRPPRGAALDEADERIADLHVLVVHHRVEELQMRADDPAAKAAALRDTLGLQVYDGQVQIGETTVSFIAGGPQGRPELHGERFV